MCRFKKIEVMKKIKVFSKFEVLKLIWSFEVLRKLKFWATILVGMWVDGWEWGYLSQAELGLELSLAILNPAVLAVGIT